MKNVLIVIASLKHGGGAEKVASGVGSKLIQKGYNVKYLTFYNADKKYSFLGDEICLNETVKSNLFLKILKLFKRAYFIKKYCRMYNINTTFSHMEEANFSNILSKIFFFNKSKIIVQIHQSLNINSKLYKTLVKLMYPFSDKIVTIVNEEKYNLINNYGINENKIAVVYNGIDINEINRLKMENLGEYKNLFDNGKFTFINIGRLSYQKNQQLLIKTFIKFNEKYNNSQLVILGEGELRSDLENQIGTHKDIYLLGNQSNPYKFLFNSDCFVFTSRYEGFGIVLLESMACGLPLISTDCPTGPKELLKNNVDNFESISTISIEEFGILTPIYSEKDLLDSMILIYSDEVIRQKLSSNSQVRILDFDINSIINKMMELI